MGSPFLDRDPRLGTLTADTVVPVRNASVHVSDSDSGATSSGGRCSVSWLAGEISVHVFPLFPLPNKVFQKRCATQEGEVIRRSRDLSMAVAAVVPTPNSTMCEPRSPYHRYLANQSLGLLTAL